MMLLKIIRVDTEQLKPSDATIKQGRHLESALLSSAQIMYISILNIPNESLKRQSMTESSIPVTKNVFHYEQTFSLLFCV